MAQSKFLDELKSMLTVHNARLYLANHFCDLRAQIDLDFVRLNDVTFKTDWIQMINKTKEFEKECLNSLARHSFFQNESAVVKEKIKLIEHKLTKFKTKFNSSQLNELNQSIKYEKLLLEKILFLNKTLVYLNNIHSVKLGKLLFISDAYLNKLSIDLFIKGYNLIFEI